MLSWVFRGVLIVGFPLIVYFGGVSHSKAGLLVGFAVDSEMDAAGRVLVSPELRQYAALEKQVWLVGQGSHFEIWSDAGWQQQQQAIFALGDKLLPPGLENLTL